MNNFLETQTYSRDAWTLVFNMWTFVFSLWKIHEHLKKCAKNISIQKIHKDVLNMQAVSKKIHEYLLKMCEHFFNELLELFSNGWTFCITWKKINAHWKLFSRYAMNSFDIHDEHFLNTWWKILFHDEHVFRYAICFIMVWTFLMHDEYFFMCAIKILYSLHYIM